MPIDPKRIQAVFLAAAEAQDDAARQALLEEECGADLDLRLRVEALLRALEQPESDLEKPAIPGLPSSALAAIEGEPNTGETLDAGPFDPAPKYTPRAVSESPGTVIGPYKLRERIGEGGMGVVYLAEQEKPVRRRVALKIIKPGMDTEQVVARFEAERQALAMMDHPNIARVFDAGATETGRPYFVMELVKGVPITDYCDTVHLTPRERLELFIPVCQAIQHAHQKGIIHRDIKPSNVLVAMQDGKPAPKVIDFGIAKAIEQKLTERSLYTQHGMVVGTLEYMSPEQADLSPMDVDTRTDVYALGVMLYELLTGSTPLDRERLRKSAYHEILRRIREEEPPKPSTRLSESRDRLPSVAARRKMEPARLTKLVRGELDWIAMKSIEKDRTRRYETANALVRDLQRYLEGDPVEAGPPSATYRLRKYARKHRTALFTAAAFVVLVGSAAVVSTAWAMRAIKAEGAAKQQQTRAEDREKTAIEAVKQFRDAVSNEPELKNTPELENLRKRLLKQPLGFFKGLRDRLQAETDTRSDNLDRLARANFELGKLTNEIGDKQDALTAFRESLVIFRKQADAHPNDPYLQKEAAAALNNIGSVLLATGKHHDALESFESALAIEQKLADAAPSDAENQNDLAARYNNVGAALASLGRPAEAMKAYKKALPIQRALADANPAVAEYQNKLAATYNNIGALLGNLGKSAEAVDAAQSALEIRKRLVETQPSVVKFQEDLASSYYNLAHHKDNSGQPGQALETYKKALALRLKLAAENPSDTSIQSDLAATHTNMGRVLSDLGRSAEELTAYKSALAIQKRLADANPTVPKFLQELAICQYNIGKLQFESGQPDAALETFKSVSAVRQKLLDYQPTNFEYQDNLAASFVSEGVVLREAERREEAVKAYEKAAAIHQRLTNSQPTVVEYANELASSQNEIGLLLAALGKPAEAIESYEKALATQRKLVREHPKSADFASDLGGTLNNMAMLDLAEKRFEEARVRLREAVELQRKALSIQPTNSTYREYMGNHLRNLVKAARGLGDVKGVSVAEADYAKFQESDPALLAFDARLAAVVEGKQKPKDNSERLTMAQRAYDKGMFSAAARLWSDALEADKTLADDRKNAHRYNAACAAVRAAMGQGSDASKLDAEAKTKFRRQALDWLEAELNVWAKILETGPAELKSAIAPTLAHWKEDSDLAGIRDHNELTKLAEAERQAFEGLWKRLEELVSKAPSAK